MADRPWRDYARTGDDPGFQSPAIFSQRGAGRRTERDSERRAVEVQWMACGGEHRDIAGILHRHVQVPALVCDDATETQFRDGGHAIWVEPGGWRDPHYAVSDVYLLDV